MDWDSGSPPSSTQTTSGAQEAVTEKTQTETTHAHQVMDMLSTAAVAAYEHCLTPSAVTDDRDTRPLATRELEFEQTMDTPVSEHVKLEADHHALTKATQS